MTTYKPKQPAKGHISPDNDQGMLEAVQCTKFSCQKWEGDTLLHPMLELRNGYMVCPVCRGSYGAPE